MPTSIRLDPQTERLLRQLARQRGQTKSEVVRAAIHSLALEMETGAEAANVTAFDRFEHVVGIADSGGAALSEDTGAEVRELIGRRRDRRSR